MQQNYPIIKPIKTKEFTTKQSHYKHCGKLPMRAVILGPSGSGKTVLLQNMILDIYKDCFSRVYIFSPSINVDMTWEPVKHYIEDKLRLKENKDEQFYYDHYDPQALEDIIKVQHKISEYQKNKGTVRYTRY